MSFNPDDYNFDTRQRKKATNPDEWISLWIWLFIALFVFPGA